MGCSASRSHHDFIHPQNPSNSGSRSLYPLSNSGSDPVHHRAVGKGDTNHLVVLTSSTYGSLVLIDQNPNPIPNFNSKFGTQLGKSLNGSDPLDPLSPASVVNTWELMEGLDDDCGSDVVQSPKKASIENEKEFDLNQVLKSYEFVENSNTMLPCKHFSEEHLCKTPTDLSKPQAMSFIEFNNTTLWSTLLPGSGFQLKGNEDKIVLYYTSLRGIRKTYEGCCDVRMIFKGFQVCVDERDISMDSSYRKELQGVFGGKDVSLPQVFIRGMHIGGVEEIKQLSEAGELPKLLRGFPMNKNGFFCGSCGDARFVPCSSCNGSRKVFKNEEKKLRRCRDCNENRLVRCPCCCT